MNDHKKKVKDLKTNRQKLLSQSNAYLLDKDLEGSELIANFVRLRVEIQKEISVIIRGVRTLAMEERYFVIIVDDLVTNKCSCPIELYVLKKDGYVVGLRRKWWKELLKFKDEEKCVITDFVRLRFDFLYDNRFREIRKNSTLIHRIGYHTFFFIFKFQPHFPSFFSKANYISIFLKNV